MKPIYEPKGRAEEYCDYAINVYTGCTHGCVYCYAKDMHNRYKPNEPFDKNVRMREGLLEALEKQLQTGKYKGKLIHLCFTCDPYPAGIDTTPTREVIKLLKKYGCHVQVLTKSGVQGRGWWDLELLDSEDWVGVSITSEQEQGIELEPNAEIMINRLNYLSSANFKGIKTWVSFEPVYSTETVYRLIICLSYVDKFAIGKLNHYKSDIDWKEFGNKCVELCEQYNRNYYIKEDLRREMEK